MSAVTLPGTLPGLLASSPANVIARCEIYFPGGAVPAGERGVYMGALTGGRILAAWDWRKPRDAPFMRRCFDIPGCDRAHLDVVMDSAGMDLAARWLAGRLLDASWGAVEGVVCHMSWRGYLEVSIWTAGMRGRPLEISVGSRFSTRLPGSFPAFEERSRTHGRPETSIHTETEPGNLPESLALACLAVAQ